MLLQFNFKNFRSFREEVSLDLTATKISEYNHHVISIGNEKVLPVAAIFGANASGKSNVYEAFQFMAQYVIFSFGYGGEDSSKRTVSNRLKTTPFLFDKSSQNAASTFEVFFVGGSDAAERTYNYGFSLDSDGITEEWLNYKSKSTRHGFKRIFYRSKNGCDYSGIPAKNRENLQVALEKETLAVSLGAKLKIARLKYIRDWFSNLDFTNFGNPMENLFLSRALPDGFVTDHEIQSNVVKYFSSFDPSIIGFHIEKVKAEKEQEEQYDIRAIHQIVDSDETVMLPLEEESAGTLKMFSLYPILQDVLKNGSLMFVDELNARLHPLLVRTVLIAFLDQEINKNHAQLIFTTHDAWQLSNNLLRRDEIWFVEKDHYGISTLYSLADFVDDAGAKIRKDESYEKNYLLGKYGAIPSLKYLNMLMEV